MQIQGYAALAAKQPVEPFAFTLPDLGLDEVTHCSICRSDVSYLDNLFGFTPFPLAS